MSELTGRGRWLPAVVLAVGIGVLFYRLLLGQVIVWGLPLLQFAPWRSAAFGALRGGRLPLWNPMVGSGAPLLANYQTAILYPPNWLYLIVPAEYAAGIVGMLHLLLAGLGMMAYLKRIGVGRLGQGVGAIGFALSGFFVARFGFLTMVDAAAWLPWLLWAVDGVVGERSEPPSTPIPPACFRKLSVLGGIVALMLLAGHAQMSFYALQMAGAYAVWRVTEIPTPHPLLLWRLLAALGGVLLGVAIAAAQLLPTAELMLHSQRSAGVDYATALSYSFWPWHFLTFLMPGFFGSPATGSYWGYGAYWEDAVYVGLLPLMLAARSVGEWVRTRRGRGEMGAPLRAVPFYAAALPVVFVLALGWNTPVFVWLFEHVPTFNLFNGPARWMVLAVFALCVLGGVGAEGWHVRRTGLAWARRGLAAGAALVIGALAGTAALGAAVQPTMLRAFGRLGVGVMALAALVLIKQRMEGNARAHTRWEALALALLVADFVSAGWGLNPTLPAAIYHQTSPLAALIPPGTRTAITPDDDYQARYSVYLSLKDFHSGDQAYWDALRESLLPNLGMLDRVASASNFDPLLVGDEAGLLRALDALSGEARITALQQMGVGTLLSTETQPGLEPIGQAGGMIAYRVPDPWPRAALADCAPAQGGGLTCQRIDAGMAEITSDAAEQVAVAVEADRAAWLVLVDTDYPGWVAAVDGQPAAITRANGAFRVVQVPPGAHTVTFSYRPASVRIGAGISAAALMVWVGLQAVGRKKTHRKDAKEEETDHLTASQ